MIIKEDSIIVRDQDRPCQGWLYSLYVLYITLGTLQRDNQNIGLAAMV